MGWGGSVREQKMFSLVTYGLLWPGKATYSVIYQLTLYVSLVGVSPADLREAV